jgi:hypothetical protein
MKNVPMTTIPTVVTDPIPEPRTGFRLESDGSEAANCAHAYIASRAKDEVACIAKSRTDTDGLVRKPAKIMCGARSMNEPVASCLSHYKLRQPFMNGGIGKDICIAWVFDYLEHPNVSNGLRETMTEFKCAEMPSEKSWNGKLTIVRN